MNVYLKYLIVALIFIAADAFWLFSNQTAYHNVILAIQGSAMELKTYLLIPIIYAIMLIGVFAICIPQAQANIQNYPNKDKNVIAFLSGALYGFVINGIYNWTSYLSYKNYPLSIIAIDSIWGMVLYGMTTLIFINL